MRDMLFGAALLAASVLPAGAAAAPATIEVNDGGEAASKLNAIFAEAAQKGFGGAVIVEVAGVPILKAGYGYANRTEKIPFTPDTIAQIGSITKPMTATAILQLAEAGKIDLQAQVRAYLPDAPEPAASATLHKLLTHHAGLADYCGGDFDVLTKTDFISRCLAQPIAHTDGQDHYSNMGFSILAAIVEQVSGQSWEDYLRAHVWTPLGMARTGFTRFAGTRPGDFATGYANDRPQGVISDRIAALSGADWNLRGNGGVQASANDMELFYRGLTQKNPGVSQYVIVGMTTPKERIDQEAWEGYGLGVRQDGNGKTFRIGHAGSDGTFLSYFGMLPQRDVFIYIVGNNGEPNIRPVLQSALKIIMDAYAPRPAPGGSRQ